MKKRFLSLGLAAVMVASLSQMADYSNKFWPGLPELPIIIPVIMTWLWLL